MTPPMTPLSGTLNRADVVFLPEQFRAAANALLDDLAALRARLAEVEALRAEWQKRAEGLQVLVDSAEAGRTRARIDGINTGVATAEEALCEKVLEALGVPFTVAHVEGTLLAAQLSAESERLQSALAEATAAQRRSSHDGCTSIIRGLEAERDALRADLTEAQSARIELQEEVDGAATRMRQLLRNTRGPNHLTEAERRDLRSVLAENARLLKRLATCPACAPSAKPSGTGGATPLASTATAAEEHVRRLKEEAELPWQSAVLAEAREHHQNANLPQHVRPEQVANAFAEAREDAHAAALERAADRVRVFFQQSPDATPELRLNAEILARDIEQDASPAAPPAPSEPTPAPLEVVERLWSPAAPSEPECATCGGERVQRNALDFTVGPCPDCAPSAKEKP